MIRDSLLKTTRSELRPKFTPWNRLTINQSEQRKQKFLCPDWSIMGTFRFTHDAHEVTENV